MYLPWFRWFVPGIMYWGTCFSCAGSGTFTAAKCAASIIIEPRSVIAPWYLVPGGMFTTGILSVHCSPAPIDSLRGVVFLVDAAAVVSLDGVGSLGLRVPRSFWSKHLPPDRNCERKPRNKQRRTQPHHTTTKHTHTILIILMKAFCVPILNNLWSKRIEVVVHLFYVTNPKNVVSSLIWSLPGYFLLPKQWSHSNPKGFFVFVTSWS